ncbi:MAG: histidine kinase [Bacteroidales bacterium]|nr:histidine kinase [Bacteroidales bacterium]
MSGRFAIRIFLISSLYAILYFAYNHFSLTGSLMLPESSWVAVLYVICFVNLAALSGSWLLSLLKSSLDINGNTYRFLIVGTMSVAWIILMSVLGGWIFKILFLKNISVDEISETYPGFIAQGLVLGIFTAIIFTVLDHSLESYNRLQKSQLTAKILLTQQLNLRFETLRNQISPHFLFNSLNTISSLIYRDTNLAEKFIRHLASVYQSVLDNYEYLVISLDKELALVEHYSYLMQVRFEKAFYIDIELPDDPEKSCVPPLSIQMLVENAIKHNQLSQETPLRVRVFTTGDSIVVQNNCIGNPQHLKIGKDLYQKPDKGKPQGVGLQNIKDRYKLLSNKPVSITRDQYFSVSLPLIPADESATLYK